MRISTELAIASLLRKAQTLPHDEALQMALGGWSVLFSS